MKNLDSFDTWALYTYSLVISHEGFIDHSTSIIRDGTTSMFVTLWKGGKALQVFILLESCPFCLCSSLYLFFCLAMECNL